MEEKYEEMLDTLYSVKSMYEYLPLIISVTVWYKLPVVPHHLVSLYESSNGNFCVICKLTQGLFELLNLVQPRAVQCQAIASHRNPFAENHYFRSTTPLFDVSGRWGVSVWLTIRSTGYHLLFSHRMR